MAAGDKFFGYKPDPFIGSRAANFTDDTRGGSSGSSSGSAHVKLSDTYNMPDGIYKITLNFQVYHRPILRTLPDKESFLHHSSHLPDGY